MKFLINIMHYFAPQSHRSMLSKTSDQDMSDKPVTSPNSSFNQHPAVKRPNSTIVLT